MPGKIQKLVNHYIKRGRPNDDDMLSLRYAVDSLDQETKELIASKLQQMLQAKLDAEGNNFGNRIIERDGSVVFAGKLGSPAATDMQVSIVGYSASNLELQIRIPKNDLYSNNNDWHKPFTELGMSCGGTISAFDGNHKDTRDQYYYREGYDNPRVVVSAGKFLEKIGLPELNLEAEKHGKRFEQTKEDGLDYQKYLERRTEAPRER